MNGALIFDVTSTILITSMDLNGAQRDEPEDMYPGTVQEKAIWMESKSRVCLLNGIAVYNTGYLVKWEFHVMTNIFLVSVCLKYCMEHTYPKNY